MSEQLESIGLTNTAVNNQLILEHLVKTGNTVTLNNTEWVKKCT